jgi:hypothetical protein
MAAIADVEAFFSSVITQVVHVTVEVDGGKQVEGGSVVNVELAFAAGDEQLVYFGSVGDALRVRHSGDGVFQSS